MPEDDEQQYFDWADNDGERIVLHQLGHAAMAGALLEIAQDIETEERRIKEEILRAAEASDTAAIKAIVSRWLRLPVAEVLPPQRHGRGAPVDTIGDSPNINHQCRPGP